MYQFTTTNIINSSLDSNGTTAKYTGTTTYLQVARVGKFLKDNILSITKRAYYAGVKEVAKVQIPTITAGLVARLTVEVRLSEQTNSEYANIALAFKKPVTVEVIATGTAGTDATALAAQINGLKDRFGFSYVTATVINTDWVQVTATDVNQRIYSMIIEKEKASPNSIIQPEYENVSSTTFAVTTAGKIGFGDNDWMARRVMLPTAENVRYFGISKDERPVLGGNYNQYTLRYKVAKEDDGIVAGGYSITTHVFYVLGSLVAAFEAEIVKTGIATDTIGSVVTAITIGGNTFDLSDDTAAGQQLTYTSTPASITGGVWARTGVDTVAGAWDTTKVLLSASGLMTVVTGHGVAAADKIGVQVTVDGFTQTGVVTFQA